MSAEQRGPLYVDGPHGCPVGGPFDLWRKNYFIENGNPPSDSVKMWPGLTFETISAIATATFHENATRTEIVARFEGGGPADELKMAHAYFCQWRRRAPFMPDELQDLPPRPAMTRPYTPEEVNEDLQQIADGYRKN
ncbi:hypothetical protein [Gordonia sp. VNK21]|uniref:hypothetical protein n=1 Tax=Gordonia sp. VNK21 TaxID=3382483 RepID=UPI0038D4F1D7